MPGGDGARGVKGWLRSALQTVNENLMCALLQAGIWCAVWACGFFAAALIANRFGAEGNGATTPFVITLGVLSGYAPKIVSLLFGSDTDFSNLMGSREGRNIKVSELPFVRMFLSFVILSTLFVLVLPAHKTSLNSSFVPTDLVDFAKATWPNFIVCLCVFLTQVIYSWPDVRVARTSSSPLGER